MGLGVPKLRAIFLEIFGHHTASNNGAWLRRKLCEKPDATRGRGRSVSIRKRDAGAAIWTTGAVKNITQVCIRFQQFSCHLTTGAVKNITQMCTRHPAFLVHGHPMTAMVNNCTNVDR